MTVGPILENSTELWPMIAPFVKLSDSMMTTMMKNMEMMKGNI